MAVTHLTHAFVVAIPMTTPPIGAYSAAEVFVETEDDLSSPPMDMFPGWAKRMAELQIQAYQIEQKKTKFSIVRPSNIYGPGDNFDLETSHVVPALLRKAHEAKVSGLERLTVWGTGTPLRELLHVDDLAHACIFLMDVYSASTPINVGCGEDISIQDLAMTVADVVGFKGELEYDHRRPDGTPKKVLDVSRLFNLGWKPKIKLRDGLAETYNWYCENCGALQRIN